MRKAFLVVWVLGLALFIVGLAGLIANTASHTVFLIVGLLVWSAGFLLFNLSRSNRPHE
jgi:uncharacterized protein YqgC (DUF456 family)